MLLVELSIFFIQICNDISCLDFEIPKQQHKGGLQKRRMYNIIPITFIPTQHFLRDLLTFVLDQQVYLQILSFLCCSGEKTYEALYPMAMFDVPLSRDNGYLWVWSEEQKMVRNGLQMWYHRRLLVESRLLYCVEDTLHVLLQGTFKMLSSTKRSKLHECQQCYTSMQYVLLQEVSSDIIVNTLLCVLCSRPTTEVFLIGSSISILTQESYHLCTEHDTCCMRISCSLCAVLQAI